MAVITLRGLSASVEKKVRRHASQRGKSMNRFLVELIEESVAGKKEGKPQEFSDLDDLIGSMDAKDVQEMEESMSRQREIDSELWR